MFGVGCINLPENKSMHIGWLAGRSLTFTEAVQAEVDAIIEKYLIKEAFFKIYQHGDYCEPRPF